MATDIPDDATPGGPALEEVTVTRPDGYQYSVQVNAQDRKALEAEGNKVSGGKAVAQPETKKAPPAKNKARSS